MMKVLCILTSFIIAVSLQAAEGTTDVVASGYAGSDQCSDCHSEEYDNWKSSRHAGESQYSSEQSPQWAQNCAGCHTTGMDTVESSWKEMGIGCEACHGPGTGHISNMGDKREIVSTVSADVCGRCHIGNPSGAGLMKDGTRWIVGYNPGMELSDIEDLQMTPLDPSALPPAPVNNHPFTYNMWQVSGHNKTFDNVFTIGEREWQGPITCVACHNPHQSDNPHQLVLSPDALCSACHTQNAVLKGSGAKGVEQTRSLHTAISCIDCHMTEKNHLMRVLRPDNPDLTAERTDTCSACHEVKIREIRADQIQDWEAWYRETMEPVQKDLRFVEESLKNNPSLLNDELKNKLQDTKSNLSIIERDRSGGVHNLDYALEIMALAKKDLAKIKAAIE